MQTAISTDTSNPLLTMTRTTPTVLWNDSADSHELRRSMTYGAVGATCNPVIAYTTLKKHPDVWRARLAELAAERPTATESELGWAAVREMSVTAAALLEPVFAEHGGRNGRLSIQTDPRLHADTDGLVEQAVEFDALAVNMIVKIPATAAGVRAMAEATYRGISINATLSFTVAQAVAAAQAVEDGLRRREAEGLDVTSMGPVITIMGGRLDDWLKAVVARDGVVLDPGHLEWAGVAALKRAYEIFVERGYRSRLLSAAYRNHMQWSELVGGDLVISPPFAWQEKFVRSGLRGEPRIDVPVDPRVLDSLRTRVPEFTRAYEVDGLTPAEFDTFGASRFTLRQFLASNHDLENLVRDVVVPDPLG
ncbi:transaldolase family protein [Cellulomonas sp. ATA003]|uniref:transaldolase family protein n=1 Tax=Cellulomonas sp. ATA003 TaxID=3073064 RepID=UPI002873EDF7|nr:transaldolase family protein [Cellulomonas sp. ATA003]WNB87073.1 transaldolase family protein [Cellulomonas sp. ATA003]